MFWLGKPAIVRHEEIEVIKKWINTSDAADIMVDRYKIGDAIQLESGPFSAQKAIVQEVTNTHYVLVLESLGCVLKMKIK